MKAQHEMVLRVAAAQATLDRFRDRPLKFGTNDCLRMAAFHVRKLGHSVKLPPSGSYASLKGALRVLKARGFETLASAVDSAGFERIAPAAAVAGDLILLPGEDGQGNELPTLGSLTVALGNGRVVGFHPDAPGGGAVPLQPTSFLAAWRVQPKRKGK